MMQLRGMHFALIIIFVFFLVVLFTTCGSNSGTIYPATRLRIEGFNNPTYPIRKTTKGSIYQPSKDLNDYYDLPTRGVEKYLVDNMICHPSCCGNQWPVPFDGLTYDEIKKCMRTEKPAGPFVNTNYTCANGLYGVGCPCIDKEAYLFLTNRGQKATNVERIEPSLIIHNNFQNPTDPPTEYEKLQSKYSVFVDTPKMNDQYYQRSMFDLDNVQSTRM